jgi:photosystem II stability/assembly factor-like uncharacterized protein
MSFSFQGHECPCSLREEPKPKRDQSTRTGVSATILPAMDSSRLSVFLFFATAVAVCQSQAPALTQAEPPSAVSQVWQMQDSGTTASLRGIDSVDGTVAWASGSEGTVLRTIDGGAHWQKCAVPDAAKDGATLDFRGVQAWDAKTAIVMASGQGDKSRLYRTTDGCKTWQSVLQNSLKDGFWDAIYFGERGDGRGRGNRGYLLGDPVDGAFLLLASFDLGKHWTKQKGAGLAVPALSQGAFAASNSSIINFRALPVFGSGGAGGAFVYLVSESEVCVDACSPEDTNDDGRKDKWARFTVPVGGNTESSGIFSIFGRAPYAGLPFFSVIIAVGGDYSKPNGGAGTAAWSSNGGKAWNASTTPPHGYRSTVQWGDSIKAWITAGTNGSDISRDDGRTWQLLDNGNWNALSLPFIVGPNGRIARINPAALPVAK